MLVVLDCHPEAKPMNQEVPGCSSHMRKHQLSKKNKNEGLSLTVIVFQSIGLWKKQIKSQAKVLNEQDICIYIYMDIFLYSFQVFGVIFPAT